MKALLMVSFGTSIPEARVGIDGFMKEACASALDLKYMESYTSNIIRRKLLREEGKTIPTPLQALAVLQDQGYKAVFVQPTHVIPGEEYDDLKGIVDNLAAIEGKYGYRKIKIGRPLLTNEEDCQTVAAILQDYYLPLLNDDETLVFMGHGSAHLANALYSQMQIAFDRLSQRILVGTVEGAPALDDVKREVKVRRVKKIVLAPFMVVAGDHARNDMAGPSEDSWLNELKAEGCEVRTSLTGFGEVPGMTRYFGLRVAEDLAGF